MENLHHPFKWRKTKFWNSFPVLFVCCFVNEINKFELCCYAAFWDLLENWVKRFSSQLQNALFQWDIYIMNFILADFYRKESWSFVSNSSYSISFLITSLPRQFHLKTRNWLKSKMETQFRAWTQICGISVRANNAGNTTCPNRVPNCDAHVARAAGVIHS